MSEGASIFNWTRLLREIRREHVIPIIGPELLPYHQTLAAPLAKALGVDVEHAARGIGAVADAAGNERARRTTDELERLLQGHAEISRSIEQLAGIKEFRLIVTTDYASLIEQAFLARGEPCRTLGFALQRRADDIDGYPLTERCVYHLLGHLELFGTIALARVDQLEYLYGLQTPAGPCELLEVLRERKNLLFLGCNLPEWLAGFFTRTLLGRPLYETHYRGMEVVACAPATDAAAAPSSLNVFLRNNHVDVYEGDAATFIDELSHRYAASEGMQPERASGTPVAALTKGFTFISYCRSDASAVRSLVRQLRQRGVDVWFDESKLTAGAQFDEEIRLAIQEDCAAFLPVISARVFETDQSYFVREWGYAASVQRDRWRNAKFVFPIVIDEPAQPDVLAQLRRRFPEFAQVHVEACPGGRQVTERLVEDLKSARKGYERRRRRAG